MSDVVNDSVQCPCGYIFHGDDLDQESGKRKPCPKCGSLKRSFNEKVEANIVAKAGVSGVHEAHMNPQSWAIFGLILGFVIPPIFYAVFSILTIGFWYKLFNMVRHDTYRVLPHTKLHNYKVTEIHSR